ncbi:MAG: transcriptional regulator [Flavobacterium sp.]|nr:transcriptional regulator [Flavobacterium sp.]
MVGQHVPESTDNQLEEPNGLASYLGLMTISDNSTKEVNSLKGLETAELFGERIAQITKQFKQSK